MGQTLRKDGDAAKRVRRMRRVLDRMLRGLETMARDLDWGRVPEDDMVKAVRAAVKAIPELASVECKLYEYEIDVAGGVPGREPPMDLAAARVEVMGRLARLAGAA